jgi:hypothetical protein
MTFALIMQRLSNLKKEMQRSSKNVIELEAESSGGQTGF